MHVTKWPSMKWTGFDGRTFLTEAEWRAYVRRPPVRFPRRDQPIALDSVCAVCNGHVEVHSPLQLAHRIPFIRGVCLLAVTPDFLDSPTNLVIAHRRHCNKMIELPLVGSLRLLREWGIAELPEFLDEVVRNAWTSSASSDSEPA